MQYVQDCTCPDQQQKSRCTCDLRGETEHHGISSVQGKIHAVTMFTTERLLVKWQDTLVISLRGGHSATTISKFTQAQNGSQSNNTLLGDLPSLLPPLLDLYPSDRSKDDAHAGQTRSLKIPEMNADTSIFLDTNDLRQNLFHEERHMRLEAGGTDEYEHMNLRGPFRLL